MNRSIIRLLISIPLLLAACSMSLLQPESDPMAIHIHTLEWTPTTVPAQAPPKAPALLVTPPRASAGYAGSDMIYVRQSHELDRFLYHRWADSPARMLEPLLLRAAEQTGLFIQVVPAGTQALTDLRLDTRLLYLRQVFAASACRVELGIRIDLIGVSSGKALGNRTFTYQDACDRASPEGGVSTANRLIGRFLGELRGGSGNCLANRRSLAWDRELYLAADGL